MEGVGALSHCREPLRSTIARPMRAHALWPCAWRKWSAMVGELGAEGACLYAMFAVGEPDRAPSLITFVKTRAYYRFRLRDRGDARCSPWTQPQRAAAGTPCAMCCGMVPENREAARHTRPFLALSAVFPPGVPHRAPLTKGRHRLRTLGACKLPWRYRGHPDCSVASCCCI